MSWKGYLLVGVGAFFVFLLLYFPADIAYGVLQNRMSREQIELKGLEGTWLSGSAASGRIRQLPVTGITWKLLPSLRSLVQAKVGFVVGGQGKVSGRLAPGITGRLAVADLRAELPLQLLRQPLSRYRLDFDGQATLHLKKIKLEGTTPQEAEGSLVLSGFRVLLPMDLPLGDFKGEVTTSNEGIKLVLTDSGGQLSANGIMLLKPDGTYSFSGDFAARGQDQPNLASALRLLGPPGRDGRVKVAYSGKLKK